MKKLLFTTFTIALLVSVSVVFASVDLTAPKNVVAYTGETQDVTIRIKNTGSSDTFSLNVFPPQFEKVGVTSDAFLITMNSGAETTIKLHFTVAIDAEPVSKSFSVTVKSTSDSTISDMENIVLDITRKTPVYIRDISLDKYDASPGDNITLDVDVFNLEDTNSGQYFLKITSSRDGSTLQTFNQQIDSIPPRSTYRFSDILRLNKYTLPGTYTVTSEIRDLSNTLKYSKSTTFSVKTVTQPSTEYTTKTSSFNILTSSVTIQVKNEGNVILPSFGVTESIPKFSQVLFTPDIEPSYTQSADGRTVYSWAIPALAPGEQYTFSYGFAIWRVWLVLGIIAGVIYFVYRWMGTPIIQKGTRHVGTITKGKEVLILIEVRNKALHEIKDVEVVDVVPQIARVLESFETLKPKLSKAPHGTVVRWQLGNLKPKEERVVTYKIKSLVDIAGSLNLPPAEIIYTDRGQNRRNVASKQALTKV